MKSWLQIIAIGCLLIAVGIGCNTVRGAGRDIEKGGEAIQRAAE
ncbi:MAG: entericidin A/B family lipoprotein [Candidatus Hydrogenedentes bacterium]|nr:entericidin A/B family lipoprotein [Candidatus Hydrogenedentota bacterium]